MPENSMNILYYAIETSITIVNESDINTINKENKLSYEVITNNGDNDNFNEIVSLFHNENKEDNKSSNFNEKKKQKSKGKKITNRWLK